MELHIKVHIKPRTRKFLGGLAAVLIMTAVFFVTVGALNQGNQAIQGLEVGSVSVNKLQKEEALERVKSVAENYLDSEIILKTPDGLEIKTTPRDMGVSLDVENSVNEAYLRGRGGSLAKDLYEQTAALFVGLTQPVTVNMDNDKFNEFVKFSLADVHKPAENARFEYNEETEEFEFVEAKTGIVVDKTNLHQKIFNSGQNLSLDTIQLIQNTDKPLVTSESAGQEAKARANEIIENMPYTVVANNDDWEVEKDDLISWMEFIPAEYDGSYVLETKISEEAVQSYLSPFAPGLSVKPVNAAFEMKGGRVQAFSLAKEGAELNITESAKIVKDTIEAGEQEILLAFNTLEPEITPESIDNLNITSLLGRGESDFGGSPRNRVHNISVGASKYHGLLVAPGEEFSFNQNLGPVNGAAGYLPELVIKQGATVPEYGGGLCQVSTTMFRAAVYSGLKISARSNHSYPVVYYGKPGFDATIYPPNPDLKFINTTPGHILIQTQIIGSRLIFDIYGQDDGRRTEVDGPYTYDAQPNGAVKAWITQTVYDKNENVMLEKTFYSNYRSPALYPVNRNPLE